MCVARGGGEGEPETGVVSSSFRLFACFSVCFCVLYTQTRPRCLGWAFLAWRVLSLSLSLSGWLVNANRTPRRTHPKSTRGPGTARPLTWRWYSVMHQARGRSIITPASPGGFTRTARAVCHVVVVDVCVCVCVCVCVDGRRAVVVG